jgi:hypothetical protein
MSQQYATVAQPGTAQINNSLLERLSVSLEVTVNFSTIQLVP